jgi:hypothetical protein
VRRQTAPAVAFTVDPKPLGEFPMLRKLIMLAITSGLLKKLYSNSSRKRTPFPTSRQHPRRPAGR